MATYKDIVQYVLNRNRKWVHTCWIAHVKEINGIQPRRASNRFPGNRRANPCPAWAKPLIEQALRHFGII
jgi:hypothetical protein